MCHVAAAQVEGPGEIVRIGDHQGVAAAASQRFADAAQLGLDGFPGEFEGMRHHRARGRGRPAGPDCIDEVLRDRRDAGPSLGRRLLQFGDALGGVKPWIVAKYGTLPQMPADPGFETGFGELNRGEDRGVHLGGGLQRVAPVHHQGRFVGKDHGSAGRAGEAREPGEAFGIRGHVFRLMLVGAGHHEPIDPRPPHRLPQGGDARRALPVARIVEGLEAGAAHDAESYAPPDEAATALRAGAVPLRRA